MDQQQQLIDAVYQYLEYIGFDETQTAFLSECEKNDIKLSPIVSVAAKKNDSINKRSKKDDNYQETTQKKLMERFIKGDLDGFFRLWREVFPSKSHSQTSTNILEFYIRVYFATFALRKTTSTKKEYNDALLVLKKYLEHGDGALLSDRTELVRYFALPYVSDPHKHPLFKELTQGKWAKNIRDQLQRHLQRHFNASTTDDERPKLLIWMESSQNRTDQTLKDLNVEYYKLFDIAGELVDALEESIQGKPISVERFDEISQRLIESNNDVSRKLSDSRINGDITNNKNHHHRSSTPIRSSTLKSAIKSTTNIESSKQTPAMIDLSATTKSAIGSTKSSTKKDATMQPAFEQVVNKHLSPTFVNLSSNNSSSIIALNYQKINSQITKSPATRDSALLLQALRQQLTRAEVQSQRNEIMGAFAQNDLLGLKNRRSTNNVVSAILAVDSNDVKEQLTRLLNAIASTRIGRIYLLTSTELIGQLIGALRTKRVKRHSADHLLAAVQKLSLRRCVQNELIQLGAIEWLLALLLDYAKLTDFQIEYGTALLMNLCLNQASRTVCIRCADQLCRLMVALMSHSNQQIRPYVNGTIYSILAIPRIRTKAVHEYELDKVVEKRLKETRNIDDQQQLPIVLKQLRGDIESNRIIGDKATVDDDYKANNDDEDNPEDDQDNDDYMEAEIDSTDTLRPTGAELFGETLLITKYRSANVTGSTAPTRQPTKRNSREQQLPPRQPNRRRKSDRHSTTSTLAVLLHADDDIEPPGTVPHRDDETRGYTPPRKSVSTLSHRTFILENDRRRPLIANRNLVASMNSGTGCSSLNYPQINQISGATNRLSIDHEDADEEIVDKRTSRLPTAKKAIERPPIGGPKKSRSLNTLASNVGTSGRRSSSSMNRQRSDADNSIDRSDGDGAESPAKIINTYPTTIAINNESAPVTTNIPQRIPDDANSYEYIAAFGSRPKVMRTPDKESLNKRRSAAMLLF